MRGSHAPSLLTLAKRTIERERLLSPGDAVLVAVSGGRDSMALLHVMSTLGKKSGYDVSACGIDHGLRPEAGRELDRAEELAAREKIPFLRMPLRVEKGGNLQARAREARYTALEEAARAAGARAIATAHHADDRAETFLLRLLQGSGIAGLAVLPPRSRGTDGTPRIRPFIRAPRTAIEAHVARHALEYTDDPSNEDLRYLRVRVRKELIPLLSSMNPNIVTHLCALADELDPQGAEAAERGRAYPLPRATQEALAALRRTRQPSARIELPGGLVACVARTQVLVQRNEERTRERRSGARSRSRSRQSK
jgi:tRNA(Ile)-lysidine synthase